MLIICGRRDPHLNILSVKSLPDLNVGYLWWWESTLECFKCKKVITHECWNWIKDEVVWWEGPMHKCLSAKRSSYLNVETEPRIKWRGERDPGKCRKVITPECYPRSHLCVVSHFLVFCSIFKNVNTAYNISQSYVKKHPHGGSQYPRFCIQCSWHRYTNVQPQ